MKKTLLLLLVLMVAGAAFGQKGGERVTHQRFVVFTHFPDAEEVYRVHQARSRTPADRIGPDWFTGWMTPAKARYYNAMPRVKAVVPDMPVYPVQFYQENPHQPLDRVDQRDLPLNGWFNYDYAGSSRYPVYIMDSGVRTTHQEFSGRASTVFDAVNDGQEDCSGHGTAVASLAAGQTYGIAKNNLVRSMRVLGCSTGQLSWVLEAVQYLIDRKDVKGHKGVVNMSFNVHAYVQQLNEKVTELVNAGYPVVVAAGNLNTDACGLSPAGSEGAVTAALSDPDSDVRLSTTAYGPCVTIFAPGNDSTAAGKDSDTAIINGFSGSSAAAPMVSGVLMVEFSRVLFGPNDPESLKYKLVTTATPGRLNMAGAPPDTPNLLLYSPMTSH